MATAMNKSNAKAARIRQKGNSFFRQHDYRKALEKYNESICWAENGSEDLAIGYANRSAVCYMVGHLEGVLTNIDLAKQHNYPKRLLWKLNTREIDSLQQLPPKSSKPPINPLAIGRWNPEVKLNVEVNPRIPFLAKDIHMEEVSEGVNGMVADRDFAPGDVILEETCVVRCLNPAEKYLVCEYCMEHYLDILIPCPNCVSAMYCTEDCRQKGWNKWHRFECDIIREVHEMFNVGKFAYVGPRMFLYGLGLFNDDVEKMMKFCKAHPRTKRDPLNLDYVNRDPIEEFKIIHMAMSDSKPSSQMEAIASMYCKIYQGSTLVQSLFTSSASETFMRQCFIDYIPALLCECNGIVSYEFFTIASHFNRTNIDANLRAVFRPNGMINLVVRRAIPAGSQLEVQQISYTLQR